MNRSLYLLTEGLFELHQLANEARQSKPLLYEGLGYSNFDIVLMEAEKQPGFLTRAADAVKKLSKASKAALVELDELANGLPTSFANSQAALAKAQKELKAMSADSGLGKIWSMMKTVSIKKLYSGDDQSLEKIAEITSDMVRYQQMVVAVYENVKEQMLELPSTVGQESLKGKPLNTWADMPGMEDLDGIDEAGIKKAIATAAKPAKWFSGLKALGGSLGIGFGGDLPFKRYGLNGKKLLEDFMGSTAEQLQQASEAAKVEPDDKKVADGLAGATDQMGKAAEEQEKAGVGSEETGSAGGEAKAGDESGSAPSGEEGSGDTSAGDAPAGSSKFLTVIKGVPGIREPEAAADKLEDLLAAGYVPQNQLLTESLTSLLLEKNVRYNDVVDALKDHLPEDEAEIPTALKALSDEMKVELGSEFGIVGIPDSTAADIQALKAEIEALRAALDTLPDDKRSAAEEQIKDNLVGAGATEEEAADIVNDEVPVDDAAAGVDAEDVDKVEAAAEESADAAEDRGITDWFKEKAGAAWDKTKDKFKTLKDSLSAEDLIILAAASADQDNAEAQKKAAEVMKRVAADQIKDEAGDELGGVINSLAGLEGDSPEEESEAGETPALDVAKSLNSIKAKIEHDDGTLAKMQDVLKSMKPGDNVKLVHGSMNDKGKRQSVLDGPLTKFAMKGGKIHGFVGDTSAEIDPELSSFKVMQSMSENKDRLARVAVARMRGYILNETNNFRYSTGLSPKQVVQEFYSRGGTNKDIVPNKKQSTVIDRWHLLAGLNDE